MAPLLPGAHSRLLLTPDALRRHARRAQRELKALGNPLSLSQSQDFLARVIGLKDWHEASQLLKDSASVHPTWTGDTVSFLKRSGEIGYRSWIFEAGRPIVAQHESGEACIVGVALTKKEALVALETLADNSSMANHILNGKPGFWDVELGDLRYSVDAEITDVGARIKASLLLKSRTLEDFSFPDALFPIISKSMGLVVVGGKSGIETSDLLGALGRHARLQYKKVISFSPVGAPLIAFDDLSDGGALTQSSVGVGDNIASYPQAILHAMRRKPAVITVAECRDPETMREIITATMSGHMMYSHVSGENVLGVFQRMADGIAPRSSSAHHWIDLVGSLSVIMVRRWVADVDGQPKAAWEYVVFDSQLVDLLFECATTAEALEIIQGRVIQC